MNESVEYLVDSLKRAEEHQAKANYYISKILKELRNNKIIINYKEVTK